MQLNAAQALIEATSTKSISVQYNFLWQQKCPISVGYTTGHNVASVKTQGEEGQLRAQERGLRGEKNKLPTL